MAQRTNTSLSQHAHRAALALVALALSGGCKDAVTSEYTLTLTTDVVVLTADGSDYATVRVVVLDQQGLPPTIGSDVILRAQNGSVDSSGRDTGTAQTDISGTAQFRVACTSTNKVQILGQYPDGGSVTGVLAEQITCQAAPAGDWRVIVSAAPRTVRPLGQTVVTVAAVDGAGAPVPTGTPLLLSINEPNPGATFRGLGTRLTIATPDASGAVAVPVTAPDATGPFSVCAQFSDTRFGAEVRCVTVNVSDRTANTSGCTGIFAPNAIPADGESTSTLTFSLFSEDGQPVSGGEIVATLEGVGEMLENPEDPDSGTDELAVGTDEAGQAEIQVVAAPRTGTADIVAFATYEIDGDVFEEECEMQALVYYPPPICAFDPIAPIVVGQTRSLRVCFENPAGQNIGPNTAVRFETVSSTGGATVTASTVLTSSIDANGDGAADDPCVTTGIAAGTNAGTARVEASIAFGATTQSCLSPPIPIVDQRVVARQLVMFCDQYNIGSRLFEFGDTVLTSCGITCTVKATDAANNPLEGAQVYFTAENGSIASTAITGPGGFASATYYPGGELAQNTPTNAGNFPGERSAPGIGGAVANQRDALTTIVAMTSGMEDFADANGNGVYDSGELFVDLPEPFVDADDDNIFTAGTHERFLDVAIPGRTANGTWDTYSGTWDPDTMIWTEQRILHSGWPSSNTVVMGVGVNVSGSNISNVQNGEFIEFIPLDDLRNSLSSVTEIAADFTGECPGVELTSALVGGGGHGNIQFNRDRRYLRGGSEVSGEGGADVMQWLTRLGFELEDAIALQIGFSVEGVPETPCTLQISVTSNLARGCTDASEAVTVFTYRVAFAP